MLATNLADLLNRASKTSYSLPAKQKPQSQTSPSSKAEHVLFVCSFVLMWDFSDMCIRCCLAFRVHQSSLPKQGFIFLKSHLVGNSLAAVGTSQITQSLNRVYENWAQALSKSVCFFQPARPDWAYLLNSRNDFPDSWPLCLGDFGNNFS